MSTPELVLTYRVASPGQVWTEEERNRTSLVEHGPDGVEIPRQREKLVRRRVEVLGATAKIITRARIEYRDHPIGDRRALSDRPRPSPIAGKRYLLDVTDGTLKITGDDGAAVSPDEDAAVRAVEKKFGRPETLGMAIARLKYAQGTPVAVPAATVARLFPGDLEVTALELTLAERDAVAVTFALRLAMSGERAGVTTRADVAGTLRLEVATAQPLEMKMLGPVHMTGALVADGTLELEAHRLAG
jgi:hypothetical protein